MVDDATLFETIELFLSETKYSPLWYPNLWAVPTTPTAYQPSFSRATPPLKERRKRHIEIQLLRDQVLQLESLRAVLATRQHEATAQNTNHCGEWKAIALHELERREQAIAINVELRTLARSRLDFARRLYKQVNHQQKLLGQVFPSSKTEHEDRHLDACVFQHTPAIYGYLGDQTMRLYKRTASALDHPRLPSTTSLVTRLRDIKHHVQGDRLVDSIDIRLVPFELAVTADAVWCWFRSAHANTTMTLHQRVLHCSDHTIYASFNVMLGTSCRGSFVVRRFDKLDRVVFVKAMVLDQGGTSDEGTRGRVVQHSQWIVLYRPVDHAQQLLPSCTEIVVRDLSEPDEESNPLADEQLHRKAAQGLTTYLDTMHEFVDNALLQSLDA